MRKICVVTGYRSDYTKLRSVIKAIEDHGALDLQIVVFGAHLLSDHGTSVRDIEADGFKIAFKCSTTIEGDLPLVMSKSIGLATIELTAAFERSMPDVVLIVGDRYEILAAAIAATVGNIPVAHIQGGEVSGTIDEVIRHAITKLSHIHFPSTRLSAKRILLMGENPQHVFNVGCSAIDHIKNIQYVDRADLRKLRGLAELKIDLERPYTILIQHPITTSYKKAGQQVKTTLEALQEVGIQTVLIYPNPDAGSEKMIVAIRKHTQKYGKQSVVKNMYKNLCFDSYLNLLKHSACLVGNSSSGVREAHAYGTPVVNIGARQKNRERTSNILDTSCNKNQIVQAVGTQIKLGKIECKNKIYGDGTAGESIADILSKIELNDIVQKSLHGDDYKC